jgi:purine-binding chemotaxis protein CheW
MDLAALSPQEVIKPSQSEDQSRHYVLFRIDRQHYALPLDHVIRAVRMVALTLVPDVPNSVLGVINMSGQIVPVIDLRRLFGQPGRHPELQDILLIVQVHGQTVAIVVDEVLNILEFTSCQVQSPPTAVSQSRFVAGAVQHKDILILVLDASRLLPNNGAERVNRLTPLESPAINGVDDINKDAMHNRKDEGKARPFLPGSTR